YWDHCYFRDPPYYPSQPDRGTARRSLAVLSRVCKSFKDVALDVLWAELENLQPLFHLNSNLKLTTQRPVTAADWSVFERYAPRVRVLGDVRSDIFGGIRADFVYAIMSFSSQSLLLPNLRALCCGGCPRNLHPCMRYLLGPNLSYLHLASNQADFWTHIMSSLVSGLCRHSPRLEFVKLHPTSSKVTEVTLHGLLFLRKIRLGLRGNEDLSYLYRIVGLQELHIQIMKPYARVKSQFRTSCLDKLVISVSDFEAFDGDMTEGWIIPCRQLQLVPHDVETSLSVERTLRKLTDRVLFDDLECITLYASTHIGEAFTVHTFTPLMRFSGLKEVDLSTWCMSLLDDDGLGSIVKSWPCLERLELGNKVIWDEDAPMITFRGLVTLLSSCPNLRTLGLVFDATNVDPITAEKPGGGVCNTNITTFSVGGSPIKRPLLVAVALEAVLPCLRKFKIEGNEYDLWEERGSDRNLQQARWEEVSEYIGVLPLIRQHQSSRV
ncbi:uncharacterized protein EDB91DRAFT_1187388, partial [Suillus paluster]|uniref:uncharacterized protein n=1 Tax=Suillus paluster TaxID=48578 RepID=UPI001B86C98A